MKRRRVVADLGLIVVCCAALPTLVFAGDKYYPVEGSVTALGKNQVTTGSGTTSFSHVHRTYTVKTATRVFVLECPNEMENILGRRECGGTKDIQLGDAIRFRVEKDRAYVLTDKGKEQKLAVLSEAVSEDTAQAAKP